MNPVTNLPLPPSCPPPVPPAPLHPPSFALTGTDDLVLPAGLSAPSGREQAVEPAVSLQVVPAARSRAARAPFVALVLSLLGGGLVSLLLINTALSQGAFAVQKLQKANLTLTEQRQQLNKSLADADQPDALARRAAALGMVPGGAPAFLRLSDGKVMGTPTIATSPPPPPPPVTATPSATPSATAPGASTATAAPTAPAPAAGAAVTSAPVTPSPGAGTGAAATTATGTTASGRTSTGKTTTPKTTTGKTTTGKATTPKTTIGKATGTAAGKPTPTKGKP